MNKLFINEDEIMSQQAREAFRSFRSNIEFTGVDNRAIVITSCLPADGKSTVSLRLAMTFAESEKKTVLVDADMLPFCSDAEEFEQKETIHQLDSAMCFLDKKCYRGTLRN